MSSGEAVEAGDAKIGTLGSTSDGSAIAMIRLDRASEARAKGIAIRAGEAVNDTLPRIGEHKALKEAALDPYLMIRNAYVQNRNKLIQS